jgi:hypothetical protein
MATSELEQACEALKIIKEQRKALEAQEDALAAKVQGYMMESSQLATYDGRILATWKNSKSTQSFSKDLFKNSMPDIYEKFIVEQPGSRRFLLK